MMVSSDIITVLDWMANQDEADSYYIDPDTAKNAKKFVSLLYQWDIPLPRLFSHGEDAVTFVWEGPKRNLYVTPLDGVARTFILPPIHGKPSVSKCDLHDPQILSSLIREINVADC